MSSSCPAPRPVSRSAPPPGRTPDGAMQQDPSIPFKDAAFAMLSHEPPIAGDERTRFIEQAQMDFQDFAIIGDATASLVDGVLTLTVDLRPPDARGSDD